MQHDHNMKVRAHSGATTRDIVDHIKPVVSLDSFVNSVGSSENGLFHSKFGRT